MQVHKAPENGHCECRPPCCNENRHLRRLDPFRCLLPINDTDKRDSRGPPKDCASEVATTSTPACGICLWSRRCNRGKPTRPINDPLTRFIPLTTPKQCSTSEGSFDTILSSLRKLDLAGLGFSHLDLDKLYRQLASYIISLPSEIPMFDEAGYTSNMNSFFTMLINNTSTKFFVTNSDSQTQKELHWHAQRPDFVFTVRGFEVLFGEIAGSLTHNNLQKKEYDLFKLARFARAARMAGCPKALLMQIANGEAKYMRVTEVDGTLCMEYVGSFVLPTTKALVLAFMDGFNIFMEIMNDLSNFDLGNRERSPRYAFDIMLERERLKQRHTL
ncbi:hypothetical protein B0O80DRAFT_475775 [Mortierella sp. GBAus27b]|nr:hypothetical protein B0O80DRAFT_475775 [Mortierella sp. GBAus27b]